MIDAPKPDGWEAMMEIAVLRMAQQHACRMWMGRRDGCKACREGKAVDSPPRRDEPMQIEYAFLADSAQAEGHRLALGREALSAPAPTESTGPRCILAHWCMAVDSCVPPAEIAP